MDFRFPSPLPSLCFPKTLPPLRAPVPALQLPAAGLSPAALEPPPPPPPPSLFLPPSSTPVSLPTTYSCYMGILLLEGSAVACKIMMALGPYVNAFCDALSVSTKPLLFKPPVFKGKTKAGLEIHPHSPFHPIPPPASQQSQLLVGA